MKNFKHHHSKGFGFLEVIGSLLMIGVILTALFTMEGSILNRFRKSWQKEDRMYEVKNSLFVLRQSGADIKEKQEIKTEAGLVTVQQEPIKKESVLARFEGLVQQKKSIVWNDERVRSLELLSYVFIPPEKKQEVKA